MPPSFGEIGGIKVSIVKNGNSYIVTCDIGGEELPAEYDFYDAVNSKKENGWKSQKTPRGNGKMSALHAKAEGSNE